MSARESHPNVNFKVFDFSIYQQNGQDLTLLTVIFARARSLRLSMIISWFDYSEFHLIGTIMF